MRLAASWCSGIRPCCFCHQLWWGNTAAVWVCSMVPALSSTISIDQDRSRKAAQKHSSDLFFSVTEWSFLILEQTAELNISVQHLPTNKVSVKHLAIKTPSYSSCKIGPNCRVFCEGCNWSAMRCIKMVSVDGLNKSMLATLKRLQIYTHSQNKFAVIVGMWILWS